ncbi:rhomboid family intramembrane serine protease [Endozoicomonas sp. SM1973]|uniref:Rhomboid family intramembrane serine protease n=1 Tax=Spartinivicinus marinus TaxID=2994442 RepID=A0A853IER8_9GAMM|nr:rhomboid family intramembrane serine protease [Spartinivicinus marinus]NYZ68534.1 rhomboid family intramembrane serine protease [Spartinivicinus marinus]
MYKAAFSSITFIITVVLLTFNLFFWSILEKSTLFGTTTQSQWLKLLTFNPLEWAEAFGLPFLLSIFFHSSAEHLISNLIMLLIVSSVCEKKLGKTNTLLLFFLTHLSSLAIIAMFYEFNFTGKPIILSGSSAAIFGMLGFYLLKERKWVICITIFCFLLLNQTNIISLFPYKYTLIDPHLIGYSIGITSSILFSKTILRYITLLK